MGRDITQCHPELQMKAALLVEKCEEQNLHIKITECFRSVAEQDDLYSQGRTTAGSIVTNAKGSSYSSQHQFGIAFDICRNDGKGAYNESDNFFRKVADIGKSIGLSCGIDWTSIYDPCHYYLPYWGSTTSKLKSIYGTPEAFKKTWSGQTANSTSANKKGPDGTIKGIQQWINQYSMDDDISEDGYYGPETKKALLKCMQIYLNIATGAKLAVDGIWGPKTEAACIVASGKSDLVRILQSVLYCRGYKPGTIDGTIGPNTRAAVKEFQKYNGLVVDGKAGRNTFKKLFN